MMANGKVFVAARTKKCQQEQKLKTEQKKRIKTKAQQREVSPNKR